tara:strand:+ start:328 stop:465 length:138 start_codon:yes stop_codon:yes gene_type:complete
MEGRVIQSGTFGGNEYYRENEGAWMTKDEARKEKITPSSLPKKNK